MPEIVLHLAEESLPIWLKTEEELDEMNVPPPYWAFAWAGGQALARHILDNPETVAGKIVLDIGSGSGLIAIAAAMASARRVIANDIDAFANEACAINAEANSATITVVGSNLISNEQDHEAVEQALQLPRIDVLCLGDVFYEKDLARHVTLLSERLHLKGAHILVGDPRRSFFPVDRFRKLVDFAVPVTRELEDNEIKNSTVWEFSG